MSPNQKTFQDSYTFYDPSGYSKADQESLAGLLEGEGFKYIEPAFGGGGQEVVLQVIAWLNFHRDTLTTDVIVAALTKLLDKLFDWHKNHTKKASETIPAVKVSVYLGDTYIQNTYEINREYSKKDLEKSLNSNEKK